MVISAAQKGSFSGKSMSVSLPRVTTESTSGARFRPEAIGDRSFIIGSSDGVLATGVLCFSDGRSFGSGCRTRGAETKWNWW